MQREIHAVPEQQCPDMDCIFWGKFSSESRQCLPLTLHSLDVALIFRKLCNLNAIRRSLDLASGSNLTPQQLDRLAVLAMLHDAGKANLGFQLKVFRKQTVPAGHVRELAPLLDPEALDPDLHQAFLQALPQELATWFSDDLVAYSYMMAIFSHHGRPLKFRGEKSGSYFRARDKWWHPQGQWDPMAAIKEIGEGARQAFPRAFKPGGVPLPKNPRLHHRFAGLLVLADWLGSHSHWFPLRHQPLSTRLQYGRETVPLLLRAVGLDVSSVRTSLDSRKLKEFRCFEDRFQFPPRPLQQAISELDPDDDNTRLVIAESETGSGKTEAALNWFFDLFVTGKVDSLYFALPSRVAARELYVRVDRTVRRWFPDPDSRPVTVLAVPGYVQVDGVAPERVLPEEDKANRWQDDEESRRRERQWASERPKRFLAAAVAVGTIDQALLSAVQTSHAHLRSVCLDRSLLVVDEVHASDSYVSCLLKFLLEHHLSIGGRAMLLSATLGAGARNTYASTALGNRPNDARVSLTPDLADAIADPYPAVTLADGIPRSTGAAIGQSKKVRFELLPYAFKPDEIVDTVVNALKATARVLIILNTVGRANTLLRTLEENAAINPAHLFSLNDTICPHHGRFAPEDRSFLDEQVSNRLGKGSAPGPLLLIGTQTLEQSLDIDADLMITDLAPADVLLQRTGRLHRHDRLRPEGFETPRCLVLVPEADLGAALDKRGYVAGAYKSVGYGSVYEDLRILELTRRVLIRHPKVSIPQDNRLLVEMATHPQRLEALTHGHWSKHREIIEGGDLACAIAAGHATAIYNQYFGECHFNELGGKVAVRLGADSLELKLDRPFKSPFGQILHHLVIPGHMAPGDPEDLITVQDEQDGISILKCGDRRYEYSRYGLEVKE